MCCLSSTSRAATRSSFSPTICSASRAAFFAPSIATVATGTPPGICTVASRASRPPMPDVLIGTPITGRVVDAASAPARWAALPAAAIMTCTPPAPAPRANSRAASGVRCAEMTRASQLTGKERSTANAGSRTGRSASLPMTTTICGMIASSLVCSHEMEKPRSPGFRAAGGSCLVGMRSESFPRLRDRPHCLMAVVPG
jgi:hypothetical protein